MHKMAPAEGDLNSAVAWPKRQGRQTRLSRLDQSAAPIGCLRDDRRASTGSIRARRPFAYVVVSDDLSNGARCRVWQTPGLTVVCFFVPRRGVGQAGLLFRGSCHTLA
jgi:hypothetical protein